MPIWMMTDQVQKVLSLDTNTAPPKGFSGVKGRLMDTGGGLLKKVKDEKKRKMRENLAKANEKAAMK